MRSHGLRFLVALALMATTASPVLADGDGEAIAPRRGPAPRIELPNDGDAYTGPTWIGHADEAALDVAPVAAAEPSVVTTTTAVSAEA